jgi:hypothetical protein
VVAQVRGVGVLAGLVGLRCYVAHFWLSFAGFGDGTRALLCFQSQSKGDSGLI